MKPIAAPEDGRTPGGPRPRHYFVQPIMPFVQLMKYLFHPLYRSCRSLAFVTSEFGFNSFWAARIDLLRQLKGLLDDSIGIKILKLCKTAGRVNPPAQ